MKEELKNMSEESLKNLEEIVESELLTVEDIRERLEFTEKGKHDRPFRIVNMFWKMILA